MFCDMTAVKYQCCKWGSVAQSCTRNQIKFCFTRAVFGRHFIKGTLSLSFFLIRKWGKEILTKLFPSLHLSSFVRNADKLSIHTKCSSHQIGCSFPMWLLLANSSAGTFGAVWGWSVAPLHHCSNRLPWQHTRPLPHCVRVCVERHFVCICQCAECV